MFNVDWTTPHAEIWTKHLGHLAGKPNTRGLEIGVLEGRSTLWFCDNILTGEGASITCVDPFLQTHREGFRMRREGYDEAKRVFLSNTNRCEEMIELFHGSSIKFYAAVGRATPRYDFAYVDGSHTLVDAATDLFWCLALLRPGGVLIVDDYEYTDVIDLGDGDLIVPGVTEACTALMAACPGLGVLHAGKQLLVKRHS